MLIVAGPVGEDAHVLAGHPERPARVDAAMRGIDDLALGSDLLVLTAPVATRGALLRVHSAEYLEELEAFCARGGGALDADTYAGSDSWDAALRAAGAGLAAVAELRGRDDGVAFVAARPPGHHAERSRAMGFCLLNNVAVAAAALAASGEKVAIVDWDVHHGNGTQDIFWDDPRVLYVSVHQWPLYPGTGRPSEVGGPRAIGTTINVPVPPGATGDVVRFALDELAAPQVDAFEADWVFVSCGFDAHRADPLAELALSSADFADLAQTVAGYARRPGRLVLFLEGGYDLPAVRRSTSATLGSLLGAGTGPEQPTSGGPGADAVRAAATARTCALDVASGAHPEPGGLRAGRTGRDRGGPGRL